MRVDDILQRLERVKKVPNGWEGCCPAHDDKQASLGIAEADDGRTLLTCRAGCTTEAVVARMGLEMKDLYVEELKPAEPEVIDVTYPYVDEAGTLLYEVVRWKPKRFQQRKPDGNGGWEWKLGDVRRVLYRLPELIEAVKTGRRIYLPEGEKDCEAIIAAGAFATTNVGGAQAWKPEYVDFLRGAHVFIVADRDGPGVKRAHTIAASLEGVAASVRILQAKTGKDAADHLAAGHTLGELEVLDEGKPADGLVLEKFSAIKATQPEWVNGLDGFIPFSAITLVAGEQGTNKSTLACYIAALVTSFYDGDVMYITTEGDPGIEIKPRLLAAAADVERCHFVRRQVDGFEGIVSFPNDIRELEAAVKKTNTKLIVIDPVLAHVDVEDTNNDNSIRTALAPLQMMAQRNNLIVLLIAHINKDKSTDPFKRVGGSKGLTGVSRSNLMMGHLREGEELRALASFKSSWSAPQQARTFRVTQEYVPEIDGYSIRALPFGTSNVKAHQLLAENRGQRD